MTVNPIQARRSGKSHPIERIAVFLRMIPSAGANSEVPVFPGESDSEADSEAEVEVEVEVEVESDPGPDTHPPSPVITNGRERKRRGDQAG
ncbi:hypothetical protein [Streptomyces sp. NPDC057966]|uniref:hypothetical protein n=1 Tax=Streptomyces sp. NPDC057966 TaxID=3346292 RepID=UPI0036E1EA0D